MGYMHPRGSSQSPRNRRQNQSSNNNARNRQEPPNYNRNVFYNSNYHYNNYNDSHKKSPPGPRDNLNYNYSSSNNNNYKNSYNDNYGNSSTYSDNYKNSHNNFSSNKNFSDSNNSSNNVDYDDPYENTKNGNTITTTSTALKWEDLDDIADRKDVPSLVELLTSCPLTDEDLNFLCNWRRLAYFFDGLLHLVVSLADDRLLRAYDAFVCRAVRMRNVSVDYWRWHCKTNIYGWYWWSLEYRRNTAIQAEPASRTE